MAKAFYTPEQHEAAMRNNHALYYAQSHGYQLIRNGRCYRMKEHDSMVFTPDGRWHWNSRGMHGRAVEFIAYYELGNAPDSLVRAILILAGESSPCPAHPPSTVSVTQPQRKPFQQPQRSPDHRRLIAYLCQTRGISLQIVQAMIGQKVLYESVAKTPNGYEAHHACFLSYNPDGHVCSAFLRGLSSTGTAFKQEVEGGDKRWGWQLRGVQPEEVCVYEACIDAASYATLLLMQGEKPLQGRDYLALGGLAMLPLTNYLQRHPQIKRVRLMLDKDPAGQDAAQRFQKVLEENGYVVEISLPEHGKDWNDTLAHYKQQSSIHKEKTI